MVCALAIASLVHAHSKPPHWLDKKLAGYLLVDDETHPSVCISDKKSGFFLERDGECDGGILWVQLTRDRNIVSQGGYAIPGFVPKDFEPGNRPIMRKKLPSLSTGKGVRINDSPAEVRRLLGKPSTVKRSGSRRQFLDFVFIWAEGERDLDATYTETYTFKAGKLIEIHFLRELNSL